MHRQMFLVVLITVGTISLADAAGSPDRYCLQGPQWDYPGDCRFNSYLQCMTVGGKDAKCRENPRYEYGRKRPSAGRGAKTE